MDELTRAVDAVLLDGLPAGLACALDAALRKGARPADILARVRRTAEGTLAYAAIEAYLEKWTRGEARVN